MNFHSTEDWREITPPSDAPKSVLVLGALEDQVGAPGAVFGAHGQLHFVIGDGALDQERDWVALPLGSNGKGDGLTLQFAFRDGRLFAFGAGHRAGNFSAIGLQ